MALNWYKSVSLKLEKDLFAAEQQDKKAKEELSYMTTAYED